MLLSLDCGMMFPAENEKPGAPEEGFRLYHSISEFLVYVSAPFPDLGRSNQAWANFFLTKGHHENRSTGIALQFQSRDI